MADTDSPDGNPYDKFSETPAPAPGPDNAPRTQIEQGRPMSTVGALPQPTEDDQAAAASGARESAGRTPRQRAQPQQAAPAAKLAAEGASPYDQFDGAPNDDGVALMERLRLNKQDAYYRSTLAGSTQLAALAHIYQTPDAPDLPPERKAVNKQQREEYVKIVADLAAHDQMEPWGTTLEAGAAFAGQLEGSMVSPESWIGWGAKGATWIARGARAGAQQAGIQFATDPLVQGLNISAGVQQDFDYLRPFLSAAAGFGIGAGGHLAGEGVGKIVGQLQLRKQLFDLGREDGSFDAPRHAAWALDPNNGIAPPAIERPEMDVIRPQMPQERGAEIPTGAQETGAAPAASRETPAPEQPRYQPGPEHGFEDAVKAEKTRLRNSYGAAQPKAARMGDEARFSAFHDEVGDILQAKVEEHQLDPASVRYGDIWKFYERAPGQAPEEALESAIAHWVSAEERRALDFEQSHLGDSELQRELDEWVRAYDSEMQRMETYSQEIDASTQMPSRFGGRQQGNYTLPGVSTIFRDYRPAHLPEEDIPFEHARPNAPEGGNLSAGGEAQPREAQGADGGGAEPAVRGERGGGAAAGGEAPAAAGAAAGQPRETLGGPREPLATERTAQGEQTVMPGAERESPEVVAARQRARDKEEAEARMRGRKGGGVPQESAEDLALFGGERQKDLLGREIPENGDLQAIAQRRKGGLMAGEQPRQAQGTPPSPAQDVAIRSLQQQAMDLAEALDFPLREGRVGSRNAAGTFNRRSGMVRVREVPDFDVVSHEAGHAIESKVGAPLTALTQANAGELRLLDYDQGPTGQRVNEGFAEYVRLMMTNPAYAQKSAPGFDTQFRQFMSAREPETLAKLDAAAAAYKAYLDAPSVDAVGSVRRSVDEDPKGIAKVIEHVRDDGLPLVIKSVLQKSYDAVMDDKAPFARAVRELGRAIRDQTGAPVDLKAADNPETLMRMLARARQGAVRDLMDGVRPYHEIAPEGPALADAISEAIGSPSVWGKWDEAKKADFDTYLIARRAEYLWRKFDAGEIPNPPVAFSRADAQMAMADLGKAMPNFKNASDMVHEYNRQLLRKSFDGGLIDADLYAKLQQDEFYVPFMRDMTDKPGAGSGMGGSGEGPGLTQVVKRLRGSSRDIKSPLESIMAQTFMVNRTLRHNDVIKAFVDLAQQAGPEGGKYVEVIPAHEAKKYTADLEQAITNRANDMGMSQADLRNILSALTDLADPSLTGSYFKMEQAAARGEPIVFYREGGQLKAARFMSEKEGHGLYELLTAAPEPVTDLWVQMTSAVGTVQRAGIISNPAFAVSNYFRDQVAASILRSDYIPFVTGAKGLAMEALQGKKGWTYGIMKTLFPDFDKTNAAVMYGYAGGVSGGASTGPVEHAFENEVNALAKKGYLVNRLTSFKGLMELASFTEAGTRNSIFGTVFEASKRKGLSDYDAMVEAAFQAQDLLDFSRHGSRTMAIRNMLPFINAHMQGLDKARRTLIEPILNRMREGQVFTRDSADFKNAWAAWTKAGAAGGALGALWAAINSDSEAYRDASPYFKGTHIVIPWGNKLLVAPKPFELGIGFTAGEAAFDGLKHKDPTAFRKFVEAAWQAIEPPDPLTGIPGVSTAFGLATGKSLMPWGWLTGESRAIVPEEVQRKPTAQQYSDRTSELAKWIGQTTGVSPMKVDYAVGNQFGLWGRDVMALSQGVNENSPAASMDDAIFFRRFVKDPTRSSNVITKFWDYMSRTTGRFNQDVAGYNDMVKDAVTRGASMGPANDFLAKMPAAERAFVTLKSGARDDGKAAFTPDERRLHPLQNAYDAIEMLNGLRKEISTNSQMTYGGREKVVLDPQSRRLLLEDVRELAQMSMRNALVIVGEPGYADRPVLDPNDTMDKIRHISPQISDEIATRYATAKVYSTEAVRKAWPQLRDRLVRNGTDADIRELSFDAKADGYQFNGSRAKRPGIPRRPIVGSPSPPP